MSSLFTYMPEEVNCLIGGFLRVEGFVDGTFIAVNKDVMPFTSITTPDGSTARVYHNSQSYTITLTLHSASSSNDVLTKFWQVDEISQMGKFPLLIKDGSGSDLFFSTESWVQEVPSVTKSNSIDSRQWVIKCANATINVGSNYGESGVVSDLINIATSALPGLGGII